MHGLTGRGPGGDLLILFRVQFPYALPALSSTFRGNIGRIVRCGLFPPISRGFGGCYVRSFAFTYSLSLRPVIIIYDARVKPHGPKSQYWKGRFQNADGPAR